MTRCPHLIARSGVCNDPALIDHQAAHVAEMMKTPEIDRAAVLAESLRAMRRNARLHYNTAMELRHSITMDSARLGDLTDAADLIDRMTAALYSIDRQLGHDDADDALRDEITAALHGKAVP